MENCNFMKKLTYICFLVLICVCSSLSIEYCIQKNWYKLGISDAKDGVAKPKTSEYRSSCSEHGVQIKSMEYLKGFEKGLEEYCTYNNGLESGKNVEDAHSLCEEANPKYKQGYNKGFREFSVEELKKKLVDDNGGKECSFSSDCTMEGSCTDNKCERSGEECSSDSDCEYENNCSSVSGWTRFNDNVSVNVCEEN